MTVSHRLGPLAERDFRLLFVGRTTSLLGTGIAPIALAFAVLDDLGGSASDLGLVLAAAWVPELVFLLVGGVWADRLPRHRVMVVTDLTMFAVQATAAVLLLTGDATLWQLVALQVVRGTAHAFFFPASTGIVPQTVSAGALQQANALLRISLSGTSAVGAAFGGVLVAVAGPAWALAFDAATFLGSAAFLFRLRLPTSATLPARRFVRELKEGWAEFWARTWLWVIVVAAAVANMTVQAGFVVLGPVVARDELGGAGAWGVVLACQAVGLVLGGALMLRFKPGRPLLVGGLGLFLSVPLLALLAAVAPLPALAAAALASGLGLEIFGVLWDTALQQHVPQDRLSRVSSYDALGSFVFIPIGLSIAGPLSDAIGVAETIWAAAAALLVVNVAQLFVGDVRNLRRREPQARAEAERAAMALR